MLMIPIHQIYTPFCSWADAKVYKRRALGPCGHAIADPVFFAGNLAVELVGFDLLLLDLHIAPRLESGKTLIEPARTAAIQPHRIARQILQKPPVMADDDQGRAQARQFVFQLCDGGQTEMVCRNA